MLGQGEHSRSVRDSLSARDRTFLAPATDEDPGRIRNEAFFLKMYGDCRKAEVTSRLRAVSWLPNHGGGTVRATTVNGVAEALEKVSRELDLLPATMIQYLVPMSGIYNCRPIAETTGFRYTPTARAIDINANSAIIGCGRKAHPARSSGAIRSRRKSSRFSSATALSGAAGGIISTACISNIDPN